MDMPDIDKIIKRTARHAYENGIGQLYFGIIVALIGLVMVAETVFRAPVALGRPRPSFWVDAMAVVALGGALLGRWLVPSLKRRLVYPRTGFVAYRKPEIPNRWLVWGMACSGGALMIAVMTIVRVTRPAAMAWLPLGWGVVGSGYLLLLAFRTGLQRFGVLAGLSVFAGLAASLSGLGEGLGSGVYFVAMGLAVTAGGALALRSYLHQAPKPEEQ